MNRFLLPCLSVLCAIAGFSQSVPQLGKNSIDEVVGAMTLNEKINVLVGPGMHVPGMELGGATEPTPAQKRVVGAAGVVNGVPRLGIPSIVVCDGPAGIHAFNSGKSRIYYATAWPIGTMLASSWDTTLVKKLGMAFGAEAKEYGIDILLAPGLNIQRNALGGRNFEYYSEDPVVTGHIASAVVKGIQSNGVGVSAKHFFANNQETNRMTVDVVASERALREIYLKGWEILTREAKPWTVMSSYNLVNGTHTSQNPELLNTVLRKEWGYEGFVMTDWFGGRDAVAQMKAGNNLIMPGTPPQREAIREAVEKGTLSQAVLDENVKGILRIIMQSPTFKQYKYSDCPDLEKNAQLSRGVAAESMVLLKNDGALPLAPTTNVALFGRNGFDLIAGGTGSGDVNKMYSVSLSEGLFNAGVSIDPELHLVYEKYEREEKLKRPKKSMMEEFMNPTPPIPEYEMSSDAILKAAEKNSFAVVAIGRNSGEGTDRKIEGEFYLTEAEKSLVKRVADAFHARGKKVIAVLNIAAPIDVVQWRDQVDAILLVWQPGMEGGNAMADVLTGKVNPSGKLAVSFPVNYADDPSARNFPGKTFTDREVPGMMGSKAYEAEVVYEEGIYVGYRYYSTFGVKPAYEFGFGLSYTDFTYSDLKLSSPTFTDGMKVSLTVTNSGKVPGKEVVQVYISAPSSRIDKPVRELKSFAKTKMLEPGESQTLTFELTPEDLASFQTSTSGWVVDKGNYVVSVGTSETVRKSAPFKVTKDNAVKKTNKVLVPREAVNELKAKR